MLILGKIGANWCKHLPHSEIPMAKLDSVAGESPRLFLKTFFRGPGEISKTLFELIPVTINFPETLFASF